MKLGIIGAMRQEIETLLAAMTEREEEERGGSTYYSGLLRGLPVVVVQCGVGKVNAALSAQILCDCFGVTHLVNTGIAGSLNPKLDIGDLVVSTDAIYHDFDCTPFGYPPCRVPGMDADAFPADRSLMELALSAAEAVNPGHCALGRIASGDQFIASPERKDRIVSLTGAVCTEMEGAAIAHAACRNGVPFVILRAISDKADDSAQMDYPTFERIAAHRCAEVTMLLAQQLLDAE